MASSLEAPDAAQSSLGGHWWGGDGPPPDRRWPGVTIPMGEAAGRYRFDHAEADRICKWFPRYCSHSKGPFAKQKFALLDYQTQLILRPLFGWIRATGDAEGTRRFRKAYIEIPKKNGKTQLIAGLALYMLLADGEAGAEVYVAAADREQARILFRAASAMVTDNPALEKRLQVYRNQIVRKDDPTAFFQVLSAEAATKHGPNIHCLIIDELHAQPDRDLFETLTRGVIARRQPLILLITTAGDDDESICYEEYDYAKRVLSGTIEDEAHLPVIFEAGKDEDWKNPEVWRRVNPGLGSTLAESAIAGFALEATHEPRKRNDFLRYHLNRWTNQATAWIPVEWWDACKEPMLSDDELRELPCVISADMSQKIDLTAVDIVFRVPLETESAPEIETSVEDETTGEVVKRKHRLNYKIAVLPAFWLPEETLVERARQDHIRYDIYRDAGELLVTEGSVIDYDAVIDYIHAQKGKSGKDLVTRFPKAKGAEFAYDPAFATDIARALRDDHGMTTVEVLQNYKHLSEACQVFEALVRSGRVIHGGHRLLRWQIENVQIKTDDAGRIRPVKPKKATKRIDGVVALLLALSRIMLMPPIQKKRKRGGFSVWTPGGFVSSDRPDQPSV